MAKYVVDLKSDELSKLEWEYAQQFPLARNEKVQFSLFTSLESIKKAINMNEPIPKCIILV